MTVFLEVDEGSADRLVERALAFGDGLFEPPAHEVRVAEVLEAFGPASPITRLRREPERLVEPGEGLGEPLLEDQAVADVFLEDRARKARVARLGAPDVEGDLILDQGLVQVVL